MAKFNDITLPEVTVKHADDLDALAKKLSVAPMSVEAMIEVGVYLKRQMDKAAELEDCYKIMGGRIKAIMDKLPPDKRETRRTKVGMATYSDAGEKVEIIDRDKVVETLTAEQLRITYAPNIKAMETILKPGDFQRLTKRTPTASKVAIKQTKGVDDYEELDIDEHEKSQF